MSRQILLEPQQDQLFRDLVEAERRVPRERREPFYVLRVNIPTGVLLMHAGWQDPNRAVFEGDIDTLAQRGLIAIMQRGNTPSFYVTPEGFNYYTELMAAMGEPMERLQKVTLDYLSNPGFQLRYPAAFVKWAKAEELLWGSDSAEEYTTIGHLLREAMQEFATELVDRFQPPNVEQDKAKTIKRIRAVIEARRRSEGVAKFLEALVSYWGAVSDLIQRQEHGGQKEGEALGWPDARRAVFQVAIIMLEVNSALLNETKS